MYWWISAASARAETRSWPKGFSTTTRPLLVRPAPASGPALVGGGVGEGAADVGETRGEALEDGVVEGLAGPRDALAGVGAQMLERPVVAGDADDRAAQEPSPLQAVER